jgi:hypothetical protein
VLDMVFRIAQGIGLEAPREWGIPNTGINVVDHGPEGYRVRAWAWTDHLEGRHEGNATSSAGGSAGSCLG